MKKYIAIAAAAVLSLSSCEDFLDSTNFTEANSSNYPATANDLNKQIAALYGVMYQYASDPLQTPWFVNTIMSDDCNGAGGTGDVECKAIGHLMANKEGLYDKAWHATYVGIASANSILATDKKVLNSIEEGARNQLLGEAYFMRGLFYMWGSQFWGDIPAYWQAAAPDPCPQQDAETVIWPHIIADFMSAYNLMKYGGTTMGDGHATKAAAGGFLARAYMFYQGFYKKVGELSNANIEPMELPEQDGVKGTLSKQDVITILNDVIANSGNGLLDEYQSLWEYTNEYTAGDYKYFTDLELKDTWAGNGNKEQIFQIQFSNSAQWSGSIGMGFTNQTALYCALRTGDDADGKHNGNTETFPFAQGWGQGTINSNLWNDWDDKDPRKRATVIDVEEELEHFAYVLDDTEETGLYNKKWVGVTTLETSANDMTEGPYIWWDILRVEAGAEQSNSNCMQGSHWGDIVLMRFADVLLMESELSGTAENMNKVRHRVGLPPTVYSLPNIQEERRYEFAGEGLRFNDLRRWSGRNGGANCLAAKMLDRQDGSRVNYTGKWTVMHHYNSSWSARYAATDGFIMIPPGQINIVDNPDVLKQNPGWGIPEANMAASPIYPVN